MRPGKATESPLESPSKRILVASDDPAERQVLVEMLGRTSVTARVTLIDSQKLEHVLERTSGAERMEVPESILVLLDINIPSLFELSDIDAIKSSPGWRAVPIIVLAGPRIDSSFLHRCYHLGANAVVQKTGSLRQLQRTLDVLVVFWLRDAFVPVIGPSRQEKA